MKELRDRENFEQFLKEQDRNKLVVVEFFADWCGPCRQIASKYKKMVDEFKSVVFAKIDVDDNEDLAEDEKILAMPTFVFYKNSKSVDTVVGANEAKLREAITKHM